MKNPKVSVIVPVYNVENFLKECLDHLIGQTLKELEIICVNDASTDRSLDILNEYSKKDKRIKVISHKKNRGLSAARNSGLEAATAQFIMFCDSDDFYDYSMCEIMYSSITQQKVDLVACGTNIIYYANENMRRSDRNYYRINFRGRMLLTDKIILKTDVSAWNKIYRKSIIDKYSIRFPDGLKNEDAFFYSAYTAVSGSIFFVPQKLYNYIRREGSIMDSVWSKKNKENDHAIDHLTVAIKFFEFLEANQLVQKNNDLFWSQFYNFEGYALWHSKTRHAKQLVRKRAQEFIAEHRDSLAASGRAAQKNISWLNKGVFGQAVITAKRAMNVITQKICPLYILQGWTLSQIEQTSTDTFEISDRITGMIHQD